jgi:hypothetical protein
VALNKLIRGKILTFAGTLWKNCPTICMERLDRLTKYLSEDSSFGG